MAKSTDTPPPDLIIPPASNSPELPFQGEDAVFLGWQKVGGTEALPLYNITAPGHPLSGSTVTDMKLLSLNLKIPFTPPPRGRVKELQIP